MIPGLVELRHQTRGDARISVAVLDGPVDLSHPCFAGADVRSLPTMHSAVATADGRMAVHGTHIASVIFGQPGSPVEGIAPGSRALIAPVFSDDGNTLSQLDLARAINQAVEAGAQVINISGGQFSQSGAAEDLLARAVQNCADHNVLIVAAVGNNGCDCLHVPAALPTVLAVGAMDDEGEPLRSSNWGDAYQTQGILAPGQEVLGAQPSGGTARMTGSSFATPVVAGVAALLLSLQVSRGAEPDPQAVRRAMLAGAEQCEFSDSQEDRQCLAGRLNITNAMHHLIGEMIMQPQSTAPEQDLTQEIPTTDADSVTPSECGCDGAQATDENEDDQLLKRARVVQSAVALEPSEATMTVVAPSAEGNGAAVAEAPEAAPVPAPQRPVAAGGGLVYAIGTLGYDFGTEARRDSFKQLMPPVSYEGVPVPGNPHDPRQMADYLGQHLSEASELLWTLNVELTPIYAFTATGPFAREVYAAFQQLLAGLVQPEDSAEYIQKVSLPGHLTGQTVRLFSGQQVPLVAVNNTRGIYGWQVNKLVEAALEAVKGDNADVDEIKARMTLADFLSRVYYEMRNLGQTSQERAINFAATNAFQVAETFSKAVGAGMELANINVMKSPFCRMDSDCWDVVLTFFDAQNLMRARKTFRFTIDVSDVIPVTLGEVRSWSTM